MKNWLAESQSDSGVSNSGGVAWDSGLAYNLCRSLFRAVSSVVRAPRSHRGGRRFKSSIAHQWPDPCVPWINGQARRLNMPRWRNGRRAAFRAQCPYGCVGSNPTLGTTKMPLASGLRLLGFRALVLPSVVRSQGGEAPPQSCACSSADRALPCGGRGRGFKSRQAHHSSLSTSLRATIPLL